MTLLGACLATLLGLVGFTLVRYRRRHRRNAEIARQWEVAQRAAIVRRLSAHLSDTPCVRKDNDTCSREPLIEEMNRVIASYFEVARERNR